MGFSFGMFIRDAYTCLPIQTILGKIVDGYTREVIQATPSPLRGEGLGGPNISHN